MSRLAHEFTLMWAWRLRICATVLLTTI